MPRADAEEWGSLVAEEVILVDQFQHGPYGLLDDLVFQNRDTERSLATIRLSPILRTTGQTLIEGYGRRVAQVARNLCREATRGNRRSHQILLRLRRPGCQQPRPPTCCLEINHRHPAERMSCVPFSFPSRFLFDRNATSYWQKREQTTDPRRYFHQF
jgi:hypothetical protein